MGLEPTSTTSIACTCNVCSRVTLHYLTISYIYPVYVGFFRSPCRSYGVAYSWNLFDPLRYNLTRLFKSGVRFVQPLVCSAIADVHPLLVLLWLTSMSFKGCLKPICKCIACYRKHVFTYRQEEKNVSVFLGFGGKDICNRKFVKNFFLFFL